ncbi:hypothetical protein Sru01_07330 [Sphaerisporangium rufum]|uniref:Uncharacterized protein n=1 Tax=Sphaerisporangium rufum TaxID=1381558 RepID=A0A919QZQ6_9ACTN|nr:hypothetical protein [Sphaerisporangium rufum]GII75751.1 hypothetical protein Sru01_07330 [Sphaerisporangium rufum]
MSEYQYYEFVAIDRPLSTAERQEVRALSTRADITATTFTNTYEWGDFSGDPAEMMERYYDAHLHVTNWGTNRLMLRLPARVLDEAAVRPYLVADRVEAWTAKEHLILDLCDEDENIEEDPEPEGWLASLIGVRAELAAGDRRPLYLAWLAAIGSWERDEDAFDDDFEGELEPPVPAGLDSLTAAQRALADLLRLDDDLLAVAAANSPARATPPTDPRRLADRVADLPEADRNALLVRVAQGEGLAVQAELTSRFTPEPGSGDAPRRSVGELLDTAAKARQRRG